METHVPPKVQPFRRTPNLKGIFVDYGTSGLIKLCRAINQSAPVDFFSSANDDNDDDYYLYSQPLHLWH